MFDINNNTNNLNNVINHEEPETNTLTKLHKYAVEGKKSKLKDLLKTAGYQIPNIDAVDRDGFTALYQACFNGHKSCVKLLLEHNANPNERSVNGGTAVHAAAISGKVEIMELVLRYGGDLRLHDRDGRKPKDWASLQLNTKLKRKMISFIEEARYKVILQTNNQRNANVAESGSSHVACGSASKPEKRSELASGFGNLCKTANDICVPTFVKMIKESELTHDPLGLTINNGAFMVLESMNWKQKLPITIKRLHETPLKGGCVDLLIDELKLISRIHHSKVLQLTGVCQIENMESIVLVFERIEKGSLFHLLYETETFKHQIDIKDIIQICISICEAIIYLHEQDILHCYVTSHSVIFTSNHVVKLANLEYAVEKSQTTSKQKKSQVINNKIANCSYGWIAPELMNDDIPTTMSDMYSFSVVIWELFNRKIPWADQDWKQIKTLVADERRSLPVNFELIPFPFNRIIKDGLSYSQFNRMSFDDVKISLDNAYPVSSMNSYSDSTKVSSLSSKFSSSEERCSAELRGKPKNGSIYPSCIPSSLPVTPQGNEQINKPIIKSILSEKKNRAPSPPKLPPRDNSSRMSTRDFFERKLKSPLNENHNTSQTHPGNISRPFNEFAPKSSKLTLRDFENNMQKVSKMTPVKYLNISQEDNAKQLLDESIASKSDSLSKKFNRTKGDRVDSPIAAPKVDSNKGTPQLTNMRKPPNPVYKDTFGSAKENGVKRPVFTSQFSQQVNHRPVPNLFFAGFGSVKNLVKSYEELPGRERDSSTQKIQQMREERNREILHVVSKMRPADDGDKLQPEGYRRLSMVKEPTGTDNEAAPIRRNERSSSVNVIYSRTKLNPEPKPPQFNTLQPKTASAQRVFDYYEERKKFFEKRSENPIQQSEIFEELQPQPQQGTTKSFYVNNDTTIEDFMSNLNQDETIGELSEGVYWEDCVFVPK